MSLDHFLVDDLTTIIPVKVEFIFSCTICKRLSVNQNNVFLANESSYIIIENMWYKETRG